MNRRGFLGSILALAAAPAIVKAESLMPLYVPKPRLLSGELGLYEGFRFIGADFAHEADYCRIPVLAGGSPIITLAPRIIIDAKAVKKYAAMLAADCQRESAFMRMLKTG